MSMAASAGVSDEVEFDFTALLTSLRRSRRKSSLHQRKRACGTIVPFSQSEEIKMIQMAPLIEPIEPIF